jgi:hypothetical protein
MLRVLLAVLCAFSGLPPVLASATASLPLHEDCCCRAEGHDTEPAGPRLAKDPCGCGCITPARTPDSFPETPRDRAGLDSVSVPCMQSACALPPPKPRGLTSNLRLVSVPPRGPPDPAVLCVWQE